MSPDEDRDRLLLASLPHVAFDGWGPEAFARGAEALELPPEAVQEHFPGGARGQVSAFSDWADRAMLAAFEQAETEGLGVTAKVALAVRLRFAALEPYQEALRRSLSVLALPSNAATGLTCLHRTCDAIWTAVGDRSTDHNWYTKRMLLGGVISTTTLYWLDDSSQDKQRTWAFLDRRLRNVVQIGGKLGKVMNRAMAIPDRLVSRLHSRRGWRRPAR
ncbi:MAG: COQ9 family protein [Rhodospirillales bacterium]